MIPRRVLFAAAEVAPIIKIGGLADVVGSLPKALRAAGHDVRIVIPSYQVIDHHKFPSRLVQPEMMVGWQGRKIAVGLRQGTLPNTDIPVYFLDCPELFHAGQAMRGLQGVYANSPDSELLRQEMQRFIFFSLAVATTLGNWEWQPDVVHIHDWHTALVTVVGKVLKKQGVKFPPTLLTIHNLQNQGRWSADEVFAWLGWSGREIPDLTKRDSFGNLNLLQLGVWAAEAVNTVSPTYAQEILTAEYGEGLAEDLQRRDGGVTGILNGLDDGFDPRTDHSLASQYSLTNLSVGKAENKRVLQAAYGLPVDPKIFVLGLVGRLVPQKGIDLVGEIIPKLAELSAQLVILGTGLPDTEALIRRAAESAPDRVGLRIGFDLALGQQIYAGADAFLMPSRFEPCGLGQMIAMRYGTLPIVRATGGLRDSVTDVTAFPEAGTGFVFEPPTGDGLQEAISRAANLYRQPASWSTALQRAMAQDFSWSHSAVAYLRLYEKIQT